MDVIRRGDVNAPGRLRGNEHPAAPVKLPGDDDFLLIAAGEGADHNRLIGGRNAVIGDLSLRITAGGRPVLQQRAFGIGLFVVGIQQHIFKEPHTEDEAHALPVIGNTAHAGIPNLLGRAAGDFPSVQENAAGRGAAKAQKSLRQGRLPVALDARYAQHLAGADGKGDILYSGAATALHAEVLYLQHLFRPNGMGPAAPGGNRFAHHHLRQLFHTGFLRGGGADDPALPNHGHAVCNLIDLPQLMRNENCGLAQLPQTAQHIKQCVGLLRRQQGGRLVENQNIRLAIQQLDDLHSLALPDGQLVHQRIRVYV